MATSRTDDNFYADSEEANATIEPIRDDFIVVSQESPKIDENKIIKGPTRQPDQPFDPFAFVDL